MAKVVVAARLPGRIDEILAGHDGGAAGGGRGASCRARGSSRSCATPTGCSRSCRCASTTRSSTARRKLRVVANYAVGYDNVDLAAAARRGVVVTNTPGVLTEATADLTMALMLAAARRLRRGRGA